MSKNWLYIIPMIAFLYVSQLFMPFDTEAETNAYTDAVLLISKILPFIALFYCLANLGSIRKLHLFFFSLPLIYFTYLVFESIYLYRTPVHYPHVFLKIMNLFIAFAIYIFYKKHHGTNLTAIMHLIMIMLFVQIIMNPEIVSVASFVNHDRALHAPSIYLLLVPCLYFFNIYIVEFKNSALIKFLILLFFIIYFQHRTVWAATGASFLFNIFLLKRQHSLDVRKSVPTVIVLFFILLMTSSLVFTYFPDVADKINENISNIMHPTEDTTGTAEWRVVQYESYWPFIKAHFIEGMRFAGYELPIQFYMPDKDIDIPVFKDGTGHHFHSFYVDIIFYFGIIGIIIFVLILLHPIYLVLKYNLTIDHKHISLISFSFGGMFFGISYNLPDFYWPMFGLALAYLEISKLVYSSRSQNVVEP